MFWGHVWNSHITIWIHTTSGMMNHLCNSSSAFQNEKCKINKIHRAVFGPSDLDDAYRLSTLLFKHASACNSTFVSWLRHKCFTLISYCSNNTQSLIRFQSHTEQILHLFEEKKEGSSMDNKGHEWRKTKKKKLLVYLRVIVLDLGLQLLDDLVPLLQFLTHGLHLALQLHDLLAALLKVLLQLALKR